MVSATAIFCRLSFLLALYGAEIAAAEILTGQVIHIADGDTLTVLATDQQRIKIRMAEIDAPEREQPFGQQSQQSLAELASNQKVTVTVRAHDDYGRTVGAVFVAGKNLDAEQVRRGMAWVYRQYATTSSLYTLEAEAKAARRGLWAAPNPIPPWDWRHSKTPNPAIPVSQHGSCGSKHRCGEMTSCAEARFYLDTCGVKSLDGDKDGTPCEVLCAKR